jgi:hypothetical protein
MNYCTEEEAKTKWCPFARVAVGFHGLFAVGNRFSDSMGGTPEVKTAALERARCLGSACMAWTPYLKTVYRAPHQAAGITQAGGLEFEDTGKGYCGLMVVGDRRS